MSEKLGALHADLDGDGDEEFVVQGDYQDRIVHALQGDGTPVAGWPVVLPEPTGVDETLSFASFSVGDVDFDGDDEVVIGVVIYAFNFPRPSPIYLLDGDGTNYTGWPIVPPHVPTAQQCPWTAIADLDGDLSAEIIGAGFQELHVFKLDGTELFYPQPSAVSRAPAVGDLDGDGVPEIIVPGFQLKVFSAGGDLLAETPLIRYQYFDGVSLADVDGDGNQEIAAISVYYQENAMVAGSWHSHFHLFDRDLNHLPGWPLDTGITTSITTELTTAMADLDGDNDIELIFPFFGLHVYDTPNPTGGQVWSDWPMWGHDTSRSGCRHHGPGAWPSYRLGDANENGGLDIGDAVAMLIHLFQAPSPSRCLPVFDFNETDSIDLADPILLLSYLFSGQLPPAGPPGCREHQLGSSMSCLSPRCP